MNFSGVLFVKRYCVFWIRRMVRGVGGGYGGTKGDKRARKGWRGNERIGG